MIRRRNKGHLPLLAAALLALAAAGCGQDQQTLIDPDRADRILDLLDDAEQQFEDGECDDLEATLENLDQQVTNINAEVEQEVRTAAVEETGQLAELADDCEPPEEETTPEPTVPEPTVTEETETEETETEPTETEETEPTETDEDDGDGGGGPPGPPEDPGEGSGDGPPEEPPGQDNGSVTPPEGEPPEADVPDEDARADASEGGA